MYGRIRPVRHPVYLVRHGQSEWNVLRLTQGQTAHPSLTEEGRRQAQSAAASIRADLDALGLRGGRVLTSDLARAVETAEVIASALGVGVEPEPRLREQHLGWLEGRSYEQTWAAADEHDWSDPALPVAGGESPLDVHDRMGAVLAELDPGVVTVLTSHGDAIRAAVAWLAGVPPHEAPWVEVPNGAVARWDGDLTWL